MSVMSFLIGAALGGVAMKIYMDKQNENIEQAHCETNCEEKIEAPASVEFTSDGILEVEPSDEEIIQLTIATLKKAKTKISIASVARESGLSSYKVGKHKNLIEKAKK